MLPFKDSVGRERPPLLSGALSTLALALWLAGVLGGGLLSLLLCVLALAIFGQSVEDVLRPARFAVLCLAAGLFSFGVQAWAGRSDQAALTLVTGGVAAGVLGAYLAIRPRGRVLTLLLVPLFGGVIELPAVLLIGGWLVAELAIGALALDEPLGGDPTWLAHLLALPLALLAVTLVGAPRD
ncbi:MAG: rhomboid family intramembrane serine protease [Solirubrobacteraceae bacterium]